MNFDIPKTQRAVQLVGLDKLVLNQSKKVTAPGLHQILCKVEAVGLCFSDLKLLKQFSNHVRKSRIISGIDEDILKQILSYVPDEKPAVPGHEAVVRICAVGENVTRFAQGQRFLVQTDYRWLQTSNSNAAFGYNFEGALQEYVLMDERVITSPQGQSMLIAVPEDISSSAIALIEPWACVEDAYVTAERTTIKTAGQMLVVAENKIDNRVFESFLRKYGRSAKITYFSQNILQTTLNIETKHIDQISQIDGTIYDDIIYFGNNTEIVEMLFSKITNSGLLNIVLCDKKLTRRINALVGKVHYGGIRIIGTTGQDPADSMKHIPRTGEIRTGEKVNIIGAAGPMGMMHVIRNICQGIKDITIYAGDLDEQRLNKLNEIVLPLAKNNNVKYLPYNSSGKSPAESFSYIVLMAPVPALVAEAIKTADENAIINIFAGIPADITAEIDLNRYIEKHMYFIGTSGSVLKDMEIVLEKVKSGKLDTNLSVAAIAGLDGAIDGIRAIEKRQTAGKIIVYPQCKKLGLVNIEQLHQKLPAIAEKMINNLWNIEAEKKLLEETR